MEARRYGTDLLNNEKNIIAHKNILQELEWNMATCQMSLSAADHH